MGKCMLNWRMERIGLRASLTYEHQYSCSETRDGKGGEMHNFFRIMDAVWVDSPVYPN
jgi:hypothetical protein